MIVIGGTDLPVSRGGRIRAFWQGRRAAASHPSEVEDENACGKTHALACASIAHMLPLGDGDSCPPVASAKSFAAAPWGNW